MKKAIARQMPSLSPEIGQQVARKMFGSLADMEPPWPRTVSRS